MDDLKRIARRAMLDRGLLPDSSPEALAQTNVDALVKMGGPIDEHARTNTTSVYTAAQIFPMLPEKLSTDLTSLANGKDRLSIVIEMTIDSHGAITDSGIYRALVHNHAKLAYNRVAAWLDGTAPMPAPVAAVQGMEQQLRIQDEVAQALKRVRRDRGALTLETIEARAVRALPETPDAVALNAFLRSVAKRTRKAFPTFHCASSSY